MADMPERIWANSAPMIHDSNNRGTWIDCMANIHHTQYIQTALVPQWHDKPTCAGLWIAKHLNGDRYLQRVSNTTTNEAYPPNRWFGPIPEDKNG